MIDSVAAEDQEQVRSFFHDFCQKRLYGPDAKAPQITYRAKSTDGNSHQYIGTFIKVDDSVGLYCCRQMPDTAENVALRMENDHLRENVKELLTHFVDGFAAFEISADGLAKPLYTSENVKMPSCFCEPERPSSSTEELTVPAGRVDHFTSFLSAIIIPPESITLWLLGDHVFQDVAHMDLQCAV